MGTEQRRNSTEKVQTQILELVQELP